MLLSSKHSGVPEDSKFPTFPSVGLHPHTWPKWGCDTKCIRRVLEEFLDVMPDELPEDLPARRRVDHAIEVMPGVEPPAKAPYRMSHEELKELKIQLEELFTKCHAPKFLVDPLEGPSMRQCGRSWNLEHDLSRSQVPCRPT